MTIARLYGQATLHLGNAVLKITDPIKAILVASSYTPNLDDHKFRSDVTGEVSATGYTTGGYTLANVTWTYEAANDRSVLKADAMNVTSMPATFKYMILYVSKGTAATDPLIGYIDFEENIDLTSKNLVINWSSTGILAIRSVTS